jgi:cytoskeletal protein CcmA (bactofilin family)
MANTVSQISYNNTFGDWVVATNSLIRENNDFAANNFVKPTGTLFLNEPTLGLQVANNAIVAGQLQVTGVGSSALVQNNLRVDRQVYFTNTTLGLVNSGQANIGGILMALGSGTSLYAANSVHISGTTRMNSTVIITGNTNISNTVYISGTTNISNTVYVTGSGSMTGSLVIGGSAAAIGAIQANFLKGNTGVDTTTMTSNIIRNTGIAYTDTLQANNLVTTANLIVTGASYFDVINANTAFVGPKISISSLFDANSAAAFFGSVKTNSDLVVGGNFVINGTTVYNSNTLIISSNLPNQNCLFGTFRTAQTGNSYIKWNETNKYWETNDVFTGTYYRLLTDQYANNSLTNSSSSNVATSFVANTIYTYSQAAFALANTTASTLSANTSTLSNSISVIQGVDLTQNTNITNLTNWLSSNVSYTQAINNAQNSAITIIQGVDNTQNTVINNLSNSLTSNVTYLNGIANTQNSTITSVNNYAQSAFDRANNASAALTFNGSTGSANANAAGYLVITGNTGVSVVGSSNILTINLPQDLRQSANPSFTTITSSVANGTAPFSVTSSTMVNNLNAQYIGGQPLSYFGDAANLSGTIPSAVLGNSALFVGTSSISLNRTSGTQTLTGVSIDGSAGSVMANTITGTTLSSSVANSSITSLGTLTALNVNGAMSLTGNPAITGQASATKGYREGVVAVGTVSSPTNLDLSLGNVFTLTLAASTTLTFTNVPSSGSVCYVTLVITQDGTGSRNPSFSPTPRWTDSSAPTLSGANKIDVLTFLCVAGSFYGSYAMANM